MTRKEWRKKWVKALRSRKYRKGRDRLREGDKFCCLGVLCDLAVKAGIPVVVRSNGNGVTYDGSSGLLPIKVQQLVGLKCNGGTYTSANHKETSLTVINDNGKSFKYIADVIEKEPKGLFMEGE